MQPSRNPDFIVDGVGYEVKRGVQLATGVVKVMMTMRQWNAVKNTNTFILVFRDQDSEPLCIVHVKDLDLMGGKNFVNNVFFHLYGVERTSIVLDSDMYAKIIEVCREIDHSNPRVDHVLAIALNIRESEPQLWNSYVLRYKMMKKLASQP
ncbi:MAG: hypothetical protein QXW52_09265 [Candidatus Caldarchaeum sp.]